MSQLPDRPDAGPEPVVPAPRSWLVEDAMPPGRRLVARVRMSGTRETPAWSAERAP